MSVTIRPYKRGGFEADIRFTANAKEHRVRKKAPVSSKSGARRWAEDLQRELMDHELTVSESISPPKEVSTLEQFAPRFVEGYVVANRHKPSGIAGKESILRIHLVPRLGRKKLDAITNEDVQQLKTALLAKSPKTVNNVLSVLKTMLRVAVEWDLVNQMPCTIRLVKAPKPEMGFLDFEEYERIVAAAESLDPATLLIVLLAGEAGLRAGEITGLRWADLDLVRGRISVNQSVWKEHITATKGERCRHLRMTRRLSQTLRAHRHLRGAYVVPGECDGHLSYKQLWRLVDRAASRAQVVRGAHRLRHTFCSHLAMKGAKLVEIKELAGHRSVTTTQGYMHLSPAAADSAIQLLDSRSSFGDMMETAEAKIAKSQP